MTAPADLLVRSGRVIDPAGGVGRDAGRAYP